MVIIVKFLTVLLVVSKYVFRAVVCKTFRGVHWTCIRLLSTTCLIISGSWQ